MKEYMQITIALGTDHRGYALKEFLKQQKRIGLYHITWSDCGAYDNQRSDYPVFAQLVCEKIIKGEVLLAVLLCGSGVGMAMAANRFSGIYAAVTWNDEIARLAREDDHCNVLVIPSDFCNEELLLSMVNVWLHAKCKEGRYTHRLDMI